MQWSQSPLGENVLFFGNITELLAAGLVG